MLTYKSYLGLQENGLKQLEPPYAIGSIVQIKGKLAIRDISLVKLMWETLSEQMLEGVHPSKIKTKRKDNARIGQLIKDLPDTVQAIIRSDSFSFWSLLDNKDPTFSTHAVSLKYGSRIQGEWYMIGILDAVPDIPMAEETPDLSKSALEHFSEVSDNLRSIIGRPESYYGVTPLAIFRPINIPATEN
mgnify:FL=1